MGSSWIRTSLPLAVSLGLALTVPPPVTAQVVSDTFDYWLVTEQNGRASLSTEQRRSGPQSLKLESASGGQRYIQYTHVFQSPAKGLFSVWFFDTAPGQQTLYAAMYAASAALPTDSFSVGVADWNASTYVWSGPGVGQTATAVPRTAGWHELTMYLSPTSYEARIDGVLVGSASGNFSVDSVFLSVSGPDWRPNAHFYFDDFEHIDLNQVVAPGPVAPPRPGTTGSQDAGSSSQTRH
jgi:hypothetical protein